LQLSLNIKRRPKGQLLKWVGNKYIHAADITGVFPLRYNKYVEPFVGTGAVLATLNPNRGMASDALVPLIEFWNLLKTSPQELLSYYKSEIERFNQDRKSVYDEVKERFNSNHNPYDMLFLSRTCYGGVMRFRKDRYMSTPIGPHKPISPEAFEKRVYEWRERIKNTDFYVMDFREAFDSVKKDDIVYCDPPYVDTQRILYGAQGFNFEDLYEKIKEAKNKGAYIALSIDGAKKSREQLINIGIPDGLFERELILDCGSSMLLRFQKNGKTMVGESVRDRLLLTW